MIEINLIGGGFQHAYSSTWWKRPKYIEWLKNSNQSNMSFYIDGSILEGTNDDKLKFGWWIESEPICNIRTQLMSSKDRLKTKYKYIFTYDKQLLDLDPDFFKRSICGGWIEDPEIYKKSKLISVIASNKNWTVGHKYRLNTINKYKDKIDVYGRGFKPIDKKEEGLKDYMFSFAFENCIQDDYMSEKVLDCFQTGTIPIYYGTKNIVNYFNRDGIIFIEEFDINKLTPELYNSKIKAVQDNFNRSLEYDVSEDFLYKKYIEKL